MKTYIYGLDGVRFFAAFIVCMFHIGLYSWAAGASSPSDMFGHVAEFPAFVPISWFGFLGVEVFFVISGFVIANSANGVPPFAFLKGRMVRLYPAAWICGTITLAALLIVKHESLGEVDASYLRSMVLLPVGPWVDGAFWSLGVEITFYALIFFLLVSRSFRLLPWLAWGMTLYSAVFLVFWATHFWVPEGHGLWRFLRMHADVMLLRHGVFFAMGIWLWMLSQKIRSWHIFAGLAIALPVGSLEVWLRGHELLTFETPIARGQWEPMAMLIWLAAFAALVALTQFPHRFTPSSPRIQSGLKWLGRMTYPLYLLNGVTGAALARVLVTHGVPPYVSATLAILGMLVLAALVASIGEPAVQRRLRAGLNRLGPPREPAAPNLP